MIIREIWLRIYGREFLGAYMLSNFAEANLLEKAKEAWKYKYGKVAGFYEALFEALTAYETSRKAFASWRNDILEQVETMEDACRQKMQKIGRGKYVVWNKRRFAEGMRRFFYAVRNFEDTMDMIYCSMSTS